MSKIIVITDLHMLPEGGRLIGLDPYERLSKAIDHINRHHRDAACLIATGDLAHRGDVASYLRLRTLLSQLVMPYHLLIGNHDRRDHFEQVFPDQTPTPGGYVQKCIATPEANLLLLDTLDAPPYEYPKAYAGWLCDQRLQWLEQSLEQAKANHQPTIIFMHHPPHATGFAGMDAIALRNGEAFYDLLLASGNVRHLVAGHIHRTISGSHRGIPFSVFKSPCHQQPLVFDATDTALSVDEPGAYGLLLLHPQGVLEHTEDYEISGLNGIMPSDAAVHGH